MKKILFGLASFLLLNMGFVATTFALDEGAIDIAVGNAVDNYEDQKLSGHTLLEQQTMVNAVLDAIKQLQATSRYAQDSLFAAVLDSLKTHLTELASEISLAITQSLLDENTVEGHDDSAETPDEELVLIPVGFPTSIEPFSAINNQALLVLGGEVSEPITNFSMTAGGEDILVEDITIIINGDSAAIDAVALYDNEGNFVAWKSVSSSEVSFSDVDLVVPMGSYNIFPVVRTRNIGYGEAGVADSQLSFSYRVDTAKGMNTGKLINVSNSYRTSKTLSVAPVLLDITMDELDRPLFLSQTELASFLLTERDNDNTHSDNAGRGLKTIIQSLEFRLFQSNIDTVSQPIFTISRTHPVNGGNNDIVGTWLPPFETLSFDLSPWANDNGIIDGSVEFTIEASNITKLDASYPTSALLILEAGNMDAVVFGSDDASYGSYGLSLESDIKSGWKTESN